ncbi:MAG: hypothetical protein HRT54_01130 [Colwellia sp.]|nr:hypothetical protein [Colwellia sp.]
MLRINVVLLFTFMFIAEFDVMANEFEHIPGEHEIGMRTRYQSVDDTWLGDAKAFTTRINLTSTFLLDEANQWQLKVQPNYVFAFNDGDYNSVAVKKNTSPIPDPEGFNLSKMVLAYDSEENWKVKLGRQNLSFDNERFIGGVDFWQTPQNFDALKFDFNDQMNWHVQYAYSNKVNRIFGKGAKSAIIKNDVRHDDYLLGYIEQRPTNELGEHSINAHLLNVEFKTDNNLTFVAYNYLVENNNQTHFSTNTRGIRINDEFKPSKIKYRYTAEYALQENKYNNPWHYQAWYSLLEASLQYKSHIFQFSQEIFSEDNQHTFITPLGTNHKFQGWADVVSGYDMQSGLRDQYITYRGRLNKIRWRAVYHKFADYESSVNIGNEFNIELAYRASRKWEFKLVYAAYKTNEGLGDFGQANHDLTTWFASVAYNI